jgi:hypothetical protein
MESKLRSTSDVSLDDVEAVASYRSVSVAAIVALALGIVSPVAIVSPVLAIVPAAAIFVGLLALVGIRRSEGQKVGGSLAHVGLLLGVCFVTASLASDYAEGWLLARQAKPWADAWIELVQQEQYEAAYELTMPAQRRTPLDEDLRQTYAATEETQQLIEDFKTSELVPLLTAMDESDRVQFLGTDETYQYGTTRQIVLKFALVYGNKALGQQPFGLVMEKRAGVGGLPGSWSVQQRMLGEK